MRVVVDANVWVSGVLLATSKPGRVIAAVRSHRVKALASETLADEILETLGHVTIRGSSVADADIAAVAQLLLPLLPDVQVAVEIRDPDDAPVVATAVAGRAEAIVTGDHDILRDETLRRWLAARGIAVFSPAEFLGEIEKKA